MEVLDGGPNKSIVFTLYFIVLIYELVFTEQHIVEVIF